MNVSDEILEGSKKEFQKVADAYRKASLTFALAGEDAGEALDQESYEQFLKEMDNDLNTPNAYAVIFELVKKINQALRVREKDLPQLAAYMNTLGKCLDILGIHLPKVELSEEDREVYRKWEAAKAEKDFATADQLRAVLIEKGLM